MLVNFIRAVILYIIILIIMRLMGKREIGQLQPFEFVISLMIANLATIPMSDTGVPILDGIVPMLGLLAMHLIITLLNLKSARFRFAICGKPNILVYRGKIDENALEKERFTVSELEERLREKDIFSFADVEYVILETNGDISVILKPEKRNVTLEDMNIQAEYTGIPYNLILDGNVMSDNLRAIGKDYKWLEKQIKKFGIKPENTLIATIDAKGDFFCQEKENKKQQKKVSNTNG